MIVERYSQNAKLGGMGATYRKVGPTCPQSCPLLGNGCYAQRNHVNIHQQRADKRQDSLDELCGLDMVRHLVSGDAFKGNRLDRPFVRQLIDWHKDNPRTRGAIYTHRISSWTSAGFTPKTIPHNLAVLASVDSMAARRKANALGWRTARIIDYEHEVARGEILCPYDLYRRHLVRPNPHTCRTCQLCWVGKKDIAFLRMGGGTR